MTESFLHYLWQHRLFRGDMVTTGGDAVTIEKVGEYNHDAGPDFINARVTVGGIQWAGMVEIHVKASDWNLHRHHLDPNYNNVVLHVVYEDDVQVFTQQGTPLATLVVQPYIPSEVWLRYASLMQPQLPLAVPCMLHIEEVPSLIQTSTLERLLVERLQRKTADVQRLLADSHDDWEVACYWMIARYLGGKANAYAFEMLAKVTPLRLFAKIKDRPLSVEALLMGQAGLLEGQFTDRYPNQLQQEYQYLRRAYGLQPMEGHLWKFFRLRPANFPTIRISQLANLMCRSENLFSRLMSTEDIDSLREMLQIETSPYWSDHFRFDCPVEGSGTKASSGKHMGRDFTDILLINAWVPLLFQYGIQYDNDGYKEMAVRILRQIPAEKNSVVRLWNKLHLSAENAAQSQALLQLYNEYCQSKRCLECAIGSYYIIKGK